MLRITALTLTEKKIRLLFDYLILINIFQYQAKKLYTQVIILKQHAEWTTCKLLQIVLQDFSIVLERQNGQLYDIDVSIKKSYT